MVADPPSPAISNEYPPRRLRTYTRTSKDAWRAPQDITKSYLRFLEENGYPLSDIEQVILGNRSSEGVYSENCT